MIFCKFCWAIFTEEGLHISFDKTHDHEKLVEGQEVCWAIDWQDDVQKFDCVPIMLHLRELMHQLQFSQDIPWDLSSIKDVFH